MSTVHGKSPPRSGRMRTGLGSGYEPLDDPGVDLRQLEGIEPLSQTLPSPTFEESDREGGGERSDAVASQSPDRDLLSSR